MGKTDEHDQDEQDAPPPQEDAEPEQPRPQTQLLPCPMTAEEAAEIADDIDELILAVTDAESEMEEEKERNKSAKSSIEERIGSLSRKLAEKSRVRRSKLINRPVEIRVENDLAHAERRVYRLDTGDLVSQRTLSSSEMMELRQPPLPAVDMEPEEDEDADPWANTTQGVAEVVEHIRAGGDLGKEDKRRLRAVVTLARGRDLDPEDPVVRACTGELDRRAKDGKGKK